MLSCMNQTGYISVTIYCLVCDVNKPEEKPRWKEMVIMYRYAAESKSLNIKNDLRMCCCQPQQIILVLLIRATCFGRTDHLQTFKHIILKLKTQAHFTFMRFHKLYKPPSRKFHCFTMHFDSLSFFHTNSCTFSYNYVSVF